MPKITKRVVDAAKAADKDYVLWDEEIQGFGLRVYVSGRKSYIVQYRKHGRSRRYAIGLHGRLSPDEARKQAKILMGHIVTGGDPAEERAMIQRDPTIHELCDAYVKDGPMWRPRKKESSWKTDRRAIERHIRPLLGNRKLSSLTKVDVQQFQADIAAGKTAMKEWTGFRGKAIVRGGPGIAARTTALLRAIINFAVDRGLRPDNPARNIQLHKTRRCERFLSSEELTRLGQVLTAEEAKPESKPSVAAIRLLVFTGCRKSEILTLRWRFVDWEQSLLRLPDSKTGAKVVPLGKPALDLLRSLPQIENEPFVFPSPRQGRHLVGLQKVWERVREAAYLPGVRLHDLRHSFASMAIAGGYSLYMVGKVLGHKDSRTTEIYAHIGADPLKEVANETAAKLAGFLNAPPLKPGNENRPKIMAAE
ncbi:MAG: site-specific integrase [Rhodospirillaceae bacterium]|nr:site-specific integrase [Rhodospirillaceae bacterium]